MLNRSKDWQEATLSPKLSFAVLDAVFGAWINASNSLVRMHTFKSLFLGAHSVREHTMVSG